MLKDNAVLMRLSLGLPGKSKKDKKTTAEVRAEKTMTQGRWINDLYPEGALDGVSKLQGEAGAYHRKVTFPFGGSGEDDGPDAIRGVGVLPGKLIIEYQKMMAEFREKMEVQVERFLDRGQEYVTWAAVNQNGAFDARNYPGSSMSASGEVTLDMGAWRSAMRKRFYLRHEPLPVPDKEHFSESMSELLGVDADSVTERVRDVGVEMQRELLRRMSQPVVHMAHKLAGQTCPCAACKGRPSKTNSFHDSLVGNVQEIVELIPAMNLGGDPQIAEFGRLMAGLTVVGPATLKGDAAERERVAKAAADIAAKMAAYTVV